MKDKKLGDKRK